MGRMDRFAAGRQVPSPDDGSVVDWSQKTQGLMENQPTFRGVDSSHCIMRGAHRWSRCAAIECAVQIVFAVSGFAQSNSSYRSMTALDRTATGALREYVPNPPRVAWPEAIPPNLDPGTYRSVVQEMLRRSVTFRSQCWRITTAANLVVTL